MLRTRLSAVTTASLVLAFGACQAESSPNGETTAGTAAVEASSPAESQPNAAQAAQAPAAQPPAVAAQELLGTTPADEAAPFNFAPDGPITDLQLPDYFVEMEVAIDGKSAGTLEIGLWPESAPNHVRNFLRYCATGFYDGLTFHRIIREFMIQGGQDTGGTRTNFGNVTAEFSQDAARSHLYGVLSAARTPDPNSANSQFFLICADAPHLDGSYTSYGKITRGLETLEALANAETVPGSPENSVPAKPVTITKATVKEGKPVGGEKIERPLPDEPEIVRVQHVLVSFKDIPRIEATRTQEEAEALAKDILARAEKGDDFTAMVREFSDDPNVPEDPSPGVYRMTNSWFRSDAIEQEQREMMQAAQAKFQAFETELTAKIAAGEVSEEEVPKLKEDFVVKLRITDLKGTITPRQQMVPAFGDVAFELEVGQVGIANFDQAKSPFGWHVIKRIE